MFHFRSEEISIPRTLADLTIYTGIVNVGEVLAHSHTEIGSWTGLADQLIHIFDPSMFLCTFITE